MSDILTAVCVLIYLAIGVFLNVISDSDEFSFCLLLFWPILVVLLILMFVVIVIPCKLAEWVRKKFKL